MQVKHLEKRLELAEFSVSVSGSLWSRILQALAGTAPKAATSVLEASFCHSGACTLAVLVPHAKRSRGFWVKTDPETTFFFLRTVLVCPKVCFFRFNQAGLLSGPMRPGFQS